MAAFRTRSSVRAVDGGGNVCSTCWKVHVMSGFESISTDRGSADDVSMCIWRDRAAVME